jgi:hypothetical protein
MNSFLHFSAPKFSIGHCFYHSVGPIQNGVFRDRVRVYFNDCNLPILRTRNIDWFTAHRTVGTVITFDDE